MFTGIVETQGTVQRIVRRGGGARLEIRVPEVVGELSLGDSVAINGACVTVTELNTVSFACDLVPETVSRTTLGLLQVDETVNVERPMRAQDRFGGHIVQGHVDAVGLVRSRRRVGAQEILEITIPFEMSRYLAPQGSVALDGVSLTVVAVDKDRFRVALIPYTVEMTTLGSRTQGSSVNVELDVLSKYVERHLVARMSRPAFLPANEGGEPEPAVRPKAAAPKAPRPKARPAAKRAAPKRAAAKKPGTQRAATKGGPAKATAKRAKAPRSGAAGKAKTVRKKATKRPAAKRTSRGKR